MPAGWMKAVAAVAAAFIVAGPMARAAVAAGDGRQTFRLERAAIARAVGALPVSRQSALFEDAGDWSAVIRLAPGREVFVTTDAMPSVRRRVVTADAAGITLLDLSNPQLPDAVERALRRLLQRSPDALARVPHGGTVVRDRLRIAPEGIFLDGRRVADVDTALRRVARADVVEIRDDLGPTSAGLMTVAMILVPAGAILHARSGGWRRPEPEVNRGTLIGLGLLAAGIITGATALTRDTDAGRSPLIYRRR